MKKVFLEILQNSQENNCARDSFYMKLQTFIPRENTRNDAHYIRYMVSMIYGLYGFLEFSWSIQACKFIKKESLTQVFSCAFCEISKNTFLQ